MHHPASPAAPQMVPAHKNRVAGYDQIAGLLAAAQACGLPNGGCAQPSFPQNGIMVPQGGWNGPRDQNGYPIGQGAISGSTTCAAWPGGPKPVRASYIGGLFPAFALGATAPTPFNVTTRNNWFLGFKFMAPDSLMGTGLGLSNLSINGMDYLDLVTPIPLEVFNALSDNETQGRIDLAWMQTPNGQATVTVTPVPAGTTAATVATFTCLQGFIASAPC